MFLDRIFTSLNEQLGAHPQYDRQTFVYLMTLILELGQLRLYSDGLRGGRTEFVSQKEHKIFLYTTASRPFLWSNDPPIQ
jgi:hypothetical protein